MKKSLFSLASLLCVLALQSCLNSGDSENHMLQIAYPDGFSVLTADQTQDSLKFYTFESFKLSSNYPDWLKINSDTEADIDNTNVLILCRSDIELAPNTTGKSRLGTITVNSYDYTCTAMYFQMGCLGINHPDYTVESTYPNSNYVLPSEVSFTLADSADIETDSICFTVYNTWKLQFVDETAPDWVQLSEKSGFSGHNNVTLTLVPNPSTEDRQTKVRLTSGSCSDEITIKQYGMVKKEETTEE